MCTTSVCRSIAELHRGRVYVESAGEGKGSTFTLELPASFNTDISFQSASESKDTPILPINNMDVTMHEVIASEFLEGEIESTSTDDLFSNLNVLIVDDAALNRKMAIRLVSGMFGRIVEAVDGLDAVTKVKRSLVEGNDVFDVILMDNVMPNMDGPTATREIRALGYTGLIIGVTGSVMPTEIDHFISCGVEEILVKPLDIEKLRGIISKRFMGDKEEENSVTMNNNGSKEADQSDAKKHSSITMKKTTTLPLITEGEQFDLISRTSSSMSAPILDEDITVFEVMCGDIKVGVFADLTALVVEGSPHRRQDLYNVLWDKFGSVSEAEDGKSAIEHVKSLMDAGGHLDVILIDYVIPNMDGPAACKELRALGYTGLIIGMTDGTNAVANENRFIIHGADYVLYDPVDTRRLEAITLGMNYMY